MAHLNRATLIGRLTASPEYRELRDGGGVTNFRIAVGKSRKNQRTGQWEKDPNPLYIDCAIFSGNNANFDLAGHIAQTIGRGSEVYVEGRLRLEEWEDKNGGGRRSKISLTVENIQTLRSAENSGNGGSQNERPAGRAYPNAPAEWGGDPDEGNFDDIPF